MFKYLKARLSLAVVTAGLALLRYFRPDPRQPTGQAARLAPVSLASKLIGADMKVSVNGAGAHYRDVDSSEDISDIDVGGARARGGQMRPDPASKSWELTLSGPVEDDFSGSFYSACKPGSTVAILSVAGIDPDDLEEAGPWYVKPRSIRYAKGEAVIERITIKASYGGVPNPTVAPTYPDPDTLT
jgi:hypothetical protein